jgi:serine/threonine-protein kinase
MTDAETPPVDIRARVGAVIGQRYKLHAVLGEGGMAAVYLAEDLTDKKRVALKLLKREHATDPLVLARFEREAKAMTVLVHENLVAALGFGLSPEGDMCLVMELVEGETLRTLLGRVKPLPLHGVAEIARQIAAGLAYAHGFGVVHRDLKPENVMISWISRPAPAGAAPPAPEPSVKILDFGMARILVDPTGTPLTRKGSVFGTPEYMPPEQGMGQPVDVRADQYAFGVMVFEMIAGRRPFQAKSPLEMVQMQIRHAPPSLVDLVPGLPPAAAAAVARMLAKSPGDRFPDVQQAAAALGQALASQVR